MPRHYNTREPWEHDAEGEGSDTKGPVASGSVDRKHPGEASPRGQKAGERLAARGWGCGGMGADGRKTQSCCFR